MKSIFHLLSGSGVAGLGLTILACACSNSTEDLAQKAESEIYRAELDFSALAQKEGVPKAFETFAADDAVINRNNTIVEGKTAIAEFYRQGNWENATLQWKPDKVFASASGDLGYTYGKYLYTSVDSAGQKITSEGIFHSVWKKQADGQWRFVWD